MAKADSAGGIRARQVITITQPGRATTSRAIHGQGEGRELPGCILGALPFAGQNALRPAMARVAGTSVDATIAAIATASITAGPALWNTLNRAKQSIPTPAIVITAELKIVATLAS